MYGLFEKDVMSLPELRENEVIDDLILTGLKIIQKTDNFRFSIDAVLLAHFVTLRNGDKIIDLGTGTGVIPLILTTRQTGLAITGVEIQKEMADMAARSVKLNNLENITVMNEDLRRLDPTFFTNHDLVVANPPYFPINQGKVNPVKEIALARHEITCTIKDLIATAQKLLKDKGRFSLVHRAERLGEIIVILVQAGLEPKRIRFVHTYDNKPANLVLIEAMKNAKSGVIIQEPLIVYTEKGSYSAEVFKYYFGGETCGK
ncbi:MAG: tRNA1(Val) (adenine(37)-N6)-methyltransferase [Peptococcaceae bacterium]